MVDHHVDRPGVEAVQAAQLTGTNRSIGLIRPPPHTQRRTGTKSTSSQTKSGLGRPGGHGEGLNTRSHPELGRENPQRRWYCVSRRGRVGRRQVCQDQKRHQHTSQPTSAGWSSPVARQAHNLKVRGSNPLPATRPTTQIQTPRPQNRRGVRRSPQIPLANSARPALAACRLAARPRA